jgi:hypothetical protein
VIGGGNVHLNGMVRISSYSDCCEKCIEVTNFGWKGHFYTTDRPNSWIQFDFNPRQVALTDYTPKSGLFKGYHLLHCKLEGSNDRENWVVRDPGLEWDVDRQELPVYTGANNTFLSVRQTDTDRRERKWRK